MINYTVYGGKGTSNQPGTKSSDLKCAKQIQATFNACAANGGGVVTFNINFKSAITRGGTVENIYVHDIKMNNVGTMLRATMDWNPAYSYSTLPAGYSYDSIPNHWKVFLQQVPPGQGTPHFRNVHLWNFTGTVRDSAVSIAGMKESPIENYYLSDIDVEARFYSDIAFAKGWRITNVSIKTPAAVDLKIRDSSDMQTEIISR